MCFVVHRVVCKSRQNVTGDLDGTQAVMKYERSTTMMKRFCEMNLLGLNEMLGESKLVTSKLVGLIEDRIKELT